MGKDQGIAGGFALESDYWIYFLFHLSYNDERHSIWSVIESYGNKETRKLFGRESSRRIPKDIQRVAFRKLRMLHRATTLDDLRVPPGNHLEPLEGKRKGEYSIRINDQWRICFVWRDGNAYDVEIVDYHR